MARQQKTRRGAAAIKVIGALVIAGGAGGAAWLAMGGSGERTVVSAADIATVSSGSFDITTIATGDLQARRQVEIRSGLDMRTQIVELVDEGTRVKEGDVLIRLNAEDIRREIQEETLRTEAARSELTSARNAVTIQESENESRLRQAQLKLELAELALRQWEEGDVMKRREELRIALEKAERDLKRLTEKAINSEELYQQNFKSKNDNELDQINAKEAEARYNIAQLEQEIYEGYIHPREKRQKMSDVEEARAEVDRVIAQNESQLASKVADLAHRQRQFEIREAKLNDLTDQLEKTTIRAPKDGLVVYWASTQGRRWDDSRGTLQVGREVNPRETLIVLPDTTEMIASVQVHESIAGRVRPGQPAMISIDALGGATVQGTVESVGVLAETGGWRDPNLREYNVRIGLKEADEALKPSMRCEAEIRLGRVEDALTVPIAAVFNEGSIHFVYRPRDGKFERVPVQVGRRSSTRAEVLAGLSEGQRILAREPRTTEVWAEPWDAAELEIAGYAFGPDGRPAPIGAIEAAEARQAVPAAGPPPPDGARPDRRNPGRRGPGERQPGEQGGSGAREAADATGAAAPATTTTGEPVGAQPAEGAAAEAVQSAETITEGAG
jgi:HlyD family secretion protein